nr:MAG TPA: hypothetical protein [Caudoviricetes sp.]
MINQSLITWYHLQHTRIREAQGCPYLPHRRLCQRPTQAHDNPLSKRPNGTSATTLHRRKREGLRASV